MKKSTANKCHLTIDGQKIEALLGESITSIARANNIYIPTLCDFKGLEPAGTCRLCMVKIDGRFQSACTTKASANLVIENDTAEIKDMRMSLIEMLFVEGNHMCPNCEKSGDCDLQAIAYRYQMLAPRFPFLFPKREVDATPPHMILEHNRCIQCRRCVRGVRTDKGEDLFAFSERGAEIKLIVNTELYADINAELAQVAVNICPVGAILSKNSAFLTPIGERKYDHKMIGTGLLKSAEGESK